MGDGDGHPVESERDVLLFFLNRVRDAVVRASAGLTGEQQRLPGVPSGTNLLGLIRHLTAVEEYWSTPVTPTSCGSGSTAPPACD
jgi:Protein of unknown function (DUF664)